jgi:hypothetical protein
MAPATALKTGFAFQSAIAALNPLAVAAALADEQHCDLCGFAGVP